ncbi:MAG: basic amino acid ABC transporter substrate-binding protein [Bifidobacteriaceae bacterium]|jgi:polar amino acid transport system substrate-binding protein|nr:basic amino acid ABC transporter substrate-binding protein [Bifidobacteriaceae bacterium]
MNIRPNKALLGLGLAACLSLTLTACGGDEDTLTVCTNPPYAPFEEVKGTEIVGFDMDLTSEVAKDMGLEIEFVETGFESIESGEALNSGSCDIGASALTINDEREAKLDFSDPYYETTLGLLVAADSGINGLADLGGKPVGVQQGTTGEDWARAQSALTEIRQYEGLGDQVTALKAGDVAGVFNDEPTLTRYEDEGFKVVGEFDTGEQFGFAVKKGDSELLDQINKTLARLHSDGTYDKLLTKWFAGE